MFFKLKVKILILSLLILSFVKDGYSIYLKKNPISNKNQIKKVDSLNIDAFNYRLNDPGKTIKIANDAFFIAQKINYLDGEAEACRVIGIGQYYLSKYESALDKYLQAISYFEQNNNFKGAGKVYNNIGNLYLLNDYDKALEYYNKSLALAKKYNPDALAGVYLNIGIIQTKKKDYHAAIEKFQISLKLFQESNNQELIIQCLQDFGEAYNGLKQYQKAETVLNEALAQAKAKKLNFTIASIELTLANVFLRQSKIDEAKTALQDGSEYAKTLENRDLQNDFNYALFQLEFKRKDYHKALTYLKNNFSQDSAYYRQSSSKRITLASDLFNQLENRRKNERIIAHQKYISTFLTAAAIVAVLLAAVVFLMVINVRRTRNSNRELTRLNTAVSAQKENLDRINHHLEDIIDERTQDLKAKNKTLSEYSLHLSHHVRGPIATLKGIVYLQENDLIDREECIQLIRKCVFSIDDEIISMSKNLNDEPDLNADKI
ncbi:MAG: tetratricopeptide repeat protein [Sphingobacteriaceae bacterium]|nr:MAG: tetratricopeptide repeat protein [Sphingobacteriaceae bacterium]